MTPTVRPEVIAMGQRYGVPTFCGALTPSEILTAWELGAACVKVFPAGAVGPSYFKAVREPLPQIPLVPSGGVTASNVSEFIRAGAVAISAGGHIIDPTAVEEEDWLTITARAAEFARVVREARENPSSSGSGRPLSD